MVRKILGLAVMAALCAGGFCLSLPVDTAAVDTDPARVILIDPGHGGADGGALGADGTREKDVNLAVSRTLSALLRVMGYETRLTREEDRSIHSPGVFSLREQKVSDMHNRLALYEGAAAVISVHQNQFSQAQYSGAQVFYGPKNPQSEALAGEIRRAITGLLQPENTRECKRADDGIYLLSHTTVPAVIVECGFLSNPEECALLADGDYQRRMAFAVSLGTMGFLE